MSCKIRYGSLVTQLRCAFSFFVVATFLLSTASAARIEINFTELDIEYDGSTIADADPGGDPEDSLAATVLTVDGILAGPIFEDPTVATIDLSIPGVSSIPVGGTGGTPISSGAGGTLSVDFGGGEFLDLTLDAASISYTPITSTLQFVFAASVATIVDQELPFDLYMGDPVAISFSTPITSLTDDGTFLTSFVARGTGEVEGEFADDPDDIIPEPSSLALVLLASLGVICASRCKE